LRQNFTAYQFHLQQIAECDAEIAALLNTLAARQPSPAAALPAPRAKTTVTKHTPAFAIRTPLHVRTSGADLSQIHSIGPQAALQLVAEIGTDMSRWPTAQHFASWTSLAPNNKISGGRLLSSRTPPSANRAAVILRRCAMTLGRSSTALGAFYRRLAARVGEAKAIPPLPASSLGWSTASSPATSSIMTPGQRLTTSSTAPVNSSRCANAPSCSASP
jgi:transposase